MREFPRDFPIVFVISVFCDVNMMSSNIRTFSILVYSWLNVYTYYGFDVIDQPRLEL